MTNNLFVYNEQSYPTRLRKQIREQLEFSPEVVAILLPDVRDSYKNKNKKRYKNSNKSKALRVLLDSGASTNTIRARHVKHHKRKILKFPFKWETTNGTFKATEKVDAKLQMLEFS